MSGAWGAAENSVRLLGLTQQLNESKAQNREEVQASVQSLRTWCASTFTQIRSEAARRDLAITELKQGQDATTTKLGTLSTELQKAATTNNSAFDAVK